ncbi:unnamed protein product [Pieris macdunnoughi]|uniref:Uncharacterized protein n=1 Tax=Pieris macdunnoughi TaxID=345717 RepID=A0A821TNY4_9NEOP|nr:unnamed protein product [Pieris macdunnoughi]
MSSKAGGKEAYTTRATGGGRYSLTLREYQLQALSVTAREISIVYVKPSCAIKKRQRGKSIPQRMRVAQLCKPGRTIR